MKNMNRLHTISIIVGISVVIYGIIMSIIEGSFQGHFQLVFIGAVLAGLGLLNKNNRKHPKY